MAEGAVFSDGQTILKWLREPFALGVFVSVEELISVHGHEGNTHIEFIEPFIVETNQ